MLLAQCLLGPFWEALFSERDGRAGWFRHSLSDVSLFFLYLPNWGEDFVQGNRRAPDAYVYGGGGGQVTRRQKKVKATRWTSFPWQLGWIRSREWVIQSSPSNPGLAWWASLAATWSLASAAGLSSVASHPSMRLRLPPKRSAVGPGGLQG